MSDELRKVDRVMLEKIRRIELLLSGMYGTGEQWRAEAECTRALLTEQPEPDAPQEVEPDDRTNRILAVRLCQAEEQRDQYKEQRDTLARLVREFADARNSPQDYKRVIESRAALLAYAEEVGGKS